MQALAWTTTPWTLPTNLALAVGPDISYVVLPAGPHGDQGRRGRRPRHGQLPARRGPAGRLRQGPRLRRRRRGSPPPRPPSPPRHTGAELDGLRYEPLWDYFADAEKYGTENAWRILVADYVTTTDGTGIVHQAPAYGEDDQKICEEAGIPVVLSVDEGAKFLPLFGHGDLAEIAGLQVFEANKPITQVLRAAGPPGPPGQLRAQLPALLALPQPADLPRRVLLVRRGHQVQGPHGPSSTRRSTGSRATSRTASSASGSPTPATGPSAATATGAAPSRSGSPTTRTTRAPTSTARWPRSRRDFGRLPLNKAGEVDLHRPFIDELTRPNPDDPAPRKRASP